MNVIFTDIDGVLFNLTSPKWNKTAIYWYNRLCSEFNLKAVISSTWRRITQNINYKIYLLKMV